MAKFRITHRGTVYPWQCDHMGHMNVMWYTGKFDEASWQFLASLGFTRTRLRKENACVAALEQHLTYKRELHAGDIVTIRSTVIEVKDKVCRVMHEMQNDGAGEIAAIATIAGVFFDATAREARSIPADLRERAEAAISCGEDVLDLSNGSEDGAEVPSQSGLSSATRN